MENIFPMVAKTFQGLEDVLRDELISLGAENVETGNRMVTFDGDLRMMYKANLCCRTALKILKPIEKFSAQNPDELYDAVRDVEWDKYMTPETTFSINSTVNSAEFTHSKFVTYRVKDGIVDYFYDKGLPRPSIRLNGADIELDVHISDNRVTISLNSSGEVLSKRGYREVANDAPINEVLAAGIIMKTGWRGESTFIDPMCGSGTFLIEAALIAANINPGIFRQGFAFEKWDDFDKDLFEELYNDDSEEREVTCKIVGADIDPEAIAITRKNIHAANLDNVIDVERKAFGEWTDAPEGEPGIMVTNPPYGERLKPEDLDNLFREVGRVLKNVFQGYHAWILGYRDEAFANIGLKPSVKYPINNGGLECSLREYVLFDGSYSEFRTKGGSVKNETFNREKTRHRYQSDDEWRKETMKFDKRKENGVKKMRRNRDDDKRGYKSEQREERRPSRFGDKKNREYRGDNDRNERRPSRFGDRKPKFREEGGREYQQRRKPQRRDYESNLYKKPLIADSDNARISERTMRSRKVWKKNIDIDTDND
jgi:putative N6-adenine-specific DNA methylase